MDIGNAGFILAVDDDLHILAYLDKLLSFNGYNVITFNKSESALDFLANKIPELILLDISIPGIDGFEMCKRIKANSKLSIIPIIFITSGIEFKVKIEALNLGAVDFITKPFQKEELLARVNTHINFFRLTELVKSQAIEIAEIKAVKEFNNELIIAKEKAEENEKKFRELFEFSNDAIFIYDIHGTLHEVNYRACEMLGYSIEELLLKKTFELYPEDFRTKIKIAHERMISEGQVVYENQLLRADGSLVQVEISSRPIGNNMNLIQDIIRDITERKHIEQKLFESEEKYKLAFETSPDAIAIYKVNGSYVDINEGFTELTGYLRDDIIGISSMDINLWANNGDRQKLIEGLRKSERVDNLEFVFRHKNGTLSTALMSASIITLNGEKHVLSMTRDISGRKEIEKALMDSEDKFSKAFYSSPACMILAKISNAEIIDVNYQVLNILGFERNEIVGHTTIEINLWVDLGQRIDYLQQVINNIPVDDEEVQFRAKSGKILFTRYSAQKIRLGDEDCILAVFVDITERKNMELELRKAKVLAEENEKRVSSMFSTANTGFVVIDSSGNLVEWNDTFINYFGYNSDEFSKLNSKDITYHEDISKSTEYINKLKTGQIENFRIEKRFVRKNKSVFWVDLFASPLKKDDKVYALLGVANDITERKKFEFELIQAKDKAEESDQLKSAFLQNMSHEIRTPMNAIMGFSSMLVKSELTGEKRNNYSRIIINSSKQLLSIVTDILTISSLETKQEKIMLEPVCINDVIVELLTIFKAQATNQNISLYSKQQLNDKQSEIYTDRTKITQVLSNLLINSLKFTPKGSVEFGYEIISQSSKKDTTIDLKSKTKLLRFYVKDTGIGIDPELKAKIFERFRQADTSISKKYGGTGLGLSISKGFVELLGGEIWVESEVSKGSTFFFTVPYNPVQKTKIGDKTGNLSKKIMTVLVAEDEEFNYLLIEELLNNMNFAILHTKDGSETVELCKANPAIDLVLMDIKMPIMDGHTAAKIIKDFRPELPIIAQSAYALEHEIEKFQGVFDGYIIKPIDEEKFMKIIQKYSKQ